MYAFTVLSSRLPNSPGVGMLDSHSRPESWGKTTKLLLAGLSLHIFILVKRWKYCMLKVILTFTNKLIAMVVPEIGPSVTLHRISDVHTGGMDGWKSRIILLQLWWLSRLNALGAVSPCTLSFLSLLTDWLRVQCWSRRFCWAVRPKSCWICWPHTCLWNWWSWHQT